MNDTSEYSGLNQLKSISIHDLFARILEKLNRIDKRLESIETRQILTEAAFTQQGTVIEGINKRCMNKLGINCPIVHNGDNEY